MTATIDRRSRVSRGARPDHPPSRDPELMEMGPQPMVQVVHPSDDPKRQLADGFRVVLPDDPWEALHALVPAIPPRDPALVPPAERSGLIRVAAAVRDLLGLPGIVAVTPDPSLPRVSESTDPLLAFGILVRCSGPVWIAGRIPAFEGLAAGSSATLLLSPRNLAILTRRTSAPDWHASVLARAAQLEVPS